MWEEVGFWKKQRYQLYNFCTNTSEGLIEHYVKVVMRERNKTKQNTLKLYNQHELEFN